jgi:O-antigen/teichoic acid export membrane protein
MLVSRLKKNKIIYSLFSSLFWSLLGTIILRFLSAVSAIFVARFLGPEVYGEYGILNSTIGLFSSLAGLGLGITCTKYIAQNYKTDKIKTGKIISLTYKISIITGVLFFVLIIIFSNILSKFSLNAPHLQIYLVIMAFLIIFNTIDGVQKGILAGFQDFRSIAIINTIQGISTVLLVITLTYNFSLSGAVFALVLVSGISVITNRVFVLKNVENHNIPISSKNLMDVMDIIYILAIPAVLSNIVVTPFIWFSNTLIARTDNGYYELGIFNAANQWKSLIDIIPGIIGAVLLPLVSSINNSDNKDSNVIEKVNLFVPWFLVVLLTLFLTSIPEVLGLLYGQEYAVFIYYQTLSILLFTSSIIAFKSSIGRKLISNDFMWFGIIDNLIWGLVFIVAVYLFRNLGSLGLSISYLGSYLINLFITIPIYIYYKIISFKLVFSIESIILWIISLSSILLILIEASLLIRIINLIFCTTTLCILFIKYLRKI